MVSKDVRSYGSRNMEMDREQHSRWVAAFANIRYRPKNEHCRLFKLPPEVRNLIFTEVARQSTVILRTFRNARPEPTGRLREILKTNRLPGLLQACRQTREEYLPIMCRDARIIVPTPGLHFKYVIDWKCTLPEAALKALKDNDRVAVAILVSEWVDSFYEDMLLWVEFRIQEETTWRYVVSQLHVDRVDWNSRTSFLSRTGVTKLRVMRDATDDMAVGQQLADLIRAFEDEGHRVDVAFRNKPFVFAKYGLRLDGSRSVGCTLRRYMQEDDDVEHWAPAVSVRAPRASGEWRASDCGAEAYDY